MDEQERQRREAMDRLLEGRARLYGPRLCKCGCGREFLPGSRPTKRYATDRCQRRADARRLRAAERMA
ncbi:MAG TPA: hypothetical protein VM844_04720 [Miltoncostaeaceae bacterium]|nr:hypothetical protein [Miltoncostaeaceae bacterium]